MFYVTDLTKDNPKWNVLQQTTQGYYFEMVGHDKLSSDVETVVHIKDKGRDRL